MKVQVEKIILKRNKELGTWNAETRNKQIPGFNLQLFSSTPNLLDSSTTLPSGSSSTDGSSCSGNPMEWFVR